MAVISLFRFEDINPKGNPIMEHEKKRTTPPPTHRIPSFPAKKQPFPQNPNSMSPYVHLVVDPWFKFIVKMPRPDPYKSSKPVPSAISHPRTKVTRRKRTENEARKAGRLWRREKGYTA